MKAAPFEFIRAASVDDAVRSAVREYIRARIDQLSPPTRAHRREGDAVAADGSIQK